MAFSYGANQSMTAAGQKVTEASVCRILPRVGDQEWRRAVQGPAAAARATKSLSGRQAVAGAQPGAAVPACAWAAAPARCLALSALCAGC